MKRHPSLIPISRQHHEGLITARLLREDAPPYKGLPTDLEGKKQYYLDFFLRHLQPHLQLEERVLFPFVRGRRQDLDALLDELEGEHRQVQDLTADLRYPEYLPAKLDRLGRVLEDHIRKEERVLFERLQELLTEPELEQLRQQVEQGQAYLNQPPYIT
jgi:iron-sulfur cluster repair protein YtfE (RIC family)